MHPTFSIAKAAGIGDFPPDTPEKLEEVAVHGILPGARRAGDFGGGS
jgi:hypothetical protein